jgi:hypothetical protein
MAVIPVPLTLLTGLGAMRLTVPPDLRGMDARQATLLMLRVRSQHIEDVQGVCHWGLLCKAHSKDVVRHSLLLPSAHSRAGGCWAMERCMYAAAAGVQ